MSYIVLARKWRPRSFGDLVGQEAASKTLKNALASGKIAHAYLFSGARGVGKTSCARILAKALNCEQRNDSEPCGECQNCKAISDGASVDVFEIDGASNNSVEAIRELRETVKYAPAGGRYKIYIIDEVHMLSTSAFNALLKTLEEPPPHVVFIFATTEPKKIPATILSRCQHHSFRRITKAGIMEQVRKISDTENIKIQDAAVEMISKAADGSMRDALTLLDQAYSFSDEIDLKELQSLLGLPESEIISNLSDSIIKGDISGTLSIVKELTDRGSDLRQLTKELVEQFRNIAVVKITRDAGDLLEFSDEEVQKLKALSSDISIEQLTLLLSELLKIEGEVRSAINPRYTLELGLLRTSFVKGMTSIESILKTLNEAPVSNEIKRPETGNSSPENPLRALNEPPKNNKSDKPELAPSPVTEKKTEIAEQTAADSSVPIIDKYEIWKKLLETIDSDDHRLFCKLEGAKVVNLTDSELVIGFNGGMSVLADSIKSQASVIQPVLQKISGQNLKLKILSLPETQPKKDIGKIKEEVFDEPLVKNALKIFDGSLLRVKSLEDSEEIKE